MQTLNCGQTFLQSLLIMFYLNLKILIIYFFLEFKINVSDYELKHRKGTICK